jgi:rRNA processing protein Krr1/Pno1
MKKEQLTLNAATQEIELDTNPNPKTVRLTPLISISLIRANNNETVKVFDSQNSFDDALEFLLDSYMIDDFKLSEISVSRKRKGDDFSKRINKVTF